MLFLLNSLAFAAPTDNIIIDLVDGATLYDLDNVAYIGSINDLNWTDASTSDDGLASGYAPNLETAIAALADNPMVEAVESVIVYHALGEKVNDPDYEKQWHMDKMHAEWIWANTNSGAGTIVAVLDTGLTVTSDFNPATVSPLAKSFTGEPVTDLNGHGTHCAGTIAEWTNNGIGGVGLANQTMIMPVKVLSDGGWGNSEWIAAGIYHALDNGADVISMSLGSNVPSKVINKAIDKAIEGGVIVVAAAGNDGFEDSVAWPAKHPPVIAVGATGPDNMRAPYSSFGEGLDIYAPGGNKKIKNGGVWQFTAPNGKEGLYEFQGTSMATPHLAAAVAILLAEGAPHDQTGIKSLLCSTADKSIFPDQYSCGHVNLKNAVQKIQKSTEFSSEDKTPSSPAGVLNLLLLLTGVIMAWRFTSNSLLTKNAIITTVVSTAFFSGPLYFLQLLGIDFPAITFLSLNIMEWPEIIAPSFSAFPLWLSFLPITPIYLIGAAFKKTRYVLMGLCTAAATYIGTNALLGFNTNVYFTFPGMSLWYIINSIVLIAMIYIAIEFDKRDNLIS